jgi:Ca2+-binding EF-hand superfamily protein
VYDRQETNAYDVIFLSSTFLFVVSIERLNDALLALGHDTRKDIAYEMFLFEHELNETNRTISGQLDFEHFALLVIDYEDKLHIDNEALRTLDLKLAFEYFDVNRGGHIRQSYLHRSLSIIHSRWYD